MLRKATFQSLSWLWDLYKRKLLDLDPPYQRRSIWNQPYKDFFVDTVLNDYPCPAIFLYENITPDGTGKYSVVDGKQRLLTLFEFANNEFPASSDASIAKGRDKYFKDLDDDTKRAFWNSILILSLGAHRSFKFVWLFFFRMGFFQVLYNGTHVT